MSSVSFASHEINASEANEVASSVYAADVDGDGDLDVLASGGETIAWYENTDGKGTFGSHRVIATIAPIEGIPLVGLSAHPADLDDDGDLDIVSKYQVGDWFSSIAWYQNTDGKGTFGPRQEVDLPSTSREAADMSAYPTDVDGDGDVDLLWDFLGNVVFWYENTDGMGTFAIHPGQFTEWTEFDRCLSSRGAPTGRLHTVDLDKDGDFDVVSQEGSHIVWFEHSDQTYGPRQTIAQDNRSIHLADLDGDTDVDIVLAAERRNAETEALEGIIIWLENLTTRISAGDANGDLRFDQDDIARVVQTGKYLKGEPATFEEGDWNGDGVFDQLDIVAALQTGNYLQGSYVARGDQQRQPTEAETTLWTRQ